MFTLTGESGVVYQVEDAPFNAADGPARLHQCRDHNGRERIAKLYGTPVTDPRAEAIRTAATRGDATLPQVDGGTAGETPESSANFPIDVLADGPAVIGVILPAIPRPFLYDDGRPRTFDSLCSASANPPASAYRAAVMIRVGEILAVLEEAELVHGDVSQRNVLWRADVPHAYLFGCDGLPQATPDPAYADPRVTANRITTPDAYSDRFALAVLMYRGLLLNPDAPGITGGAWQATGLPTDLDPRLRDLFDRAFTDPDSTDTRPTAAQWRDTLRGVFLNPDGSYNTEAVAVLDRYVQRFRDAGAPPTGGSGPAPGTAVMPPAMFSAGMGPGGPGGPGPGAYGPGGPGGPGPYGPGGPGFGPGPGGPPPKQGMSPALLVAIIGVPVVVIGVIIAAVVAWGTLHHRAVVAVSTATPTGPYASPTDPYATPTDPYATPTDPYPTDSYTPAPDPTTPDDDPTTYQPPEEHYGAIAVASDGRVGKSWDYSSSSSAESRAISECARSSCKVLTSFVNSCGAVAYNPSTNRYWGGHGDTKGEAESNAISNAGGGHWIAWVCTTS